MPTQREDTMNIVVFGATGMIGTEIVAALEQRGHQVTGASRSTGIDITDPAAVAGAVTGADVAISAVSARSGTYTLVDVAHALIDGIRRSSGDPRLIVVGGAGSLEVAPGVRLIDTPDFPEEYKPEAAQAAEALAVYREVTDLSWTYVSPAAFIHPAEKTGSYRLGGDQLLVDDAGNSEISVADFALAVADLAEQGGHARARVTAAW
jgi:putative NADH-flavin reductase